MFVNLCVYTLSKYIYPIANIRQNEQCEPGLVFSSSGGSFLGLLVFSLCFPSTLELMQLGTETVQVQLTSLSYGFSQCLVLTELRI